MTWIDGLKFENSLKIEFQVINVINENMLSPAKKNFCCQSRSIYIRLKTDKEMVLKKKIVAGNASCVTIIKLMRFHTFINLLSIDKIIMSSHNQKLFRISTDMQMFKIIHIFNDNKYNKHLRTALRKCWIWFFFSSFIVAGFSWVTGY